MNESTASPICQIHCLKEMAHPTTPLDGLVHFYCRIKRFAKRRGTFLLNLAGAVAHPHSSAATDSETLTAVRPLQTGDRVRILSRAQIQATLDKWNSLGGCTFLEEMWPYCGTEQRVFKRVERFLDERDYRIKRTSKSVLLESVICNGTVDFGKCDRSCFFFWREEWLERLD